MCVYKSDDGICNKYSTDCVTSYCVDGPCTEEVLTNADKIRSMTDGDLARFLLDVDISDEIPFCQCLLQCEEDLEADRPIPESRCLECMMGWLRKAAT